MEISIISDRLVRDVRESFLKEYNPPTEEGAGGVRGGSTVSESEFESAFATADSTLRLSIIRHLHNVLDEFGDNDQQIPEYYVYCFNGSLRRMAGKAQPLTDLISNALKELALCELFKSINPEIADYHSKLAAARLEQIDTLLLIKNAPIKKI